MIILLAADSDDARRWYDRAGRPDVPVVTVLRAVDVRADVIEPGARIVRTRRWPYSQRTVSALQALHARVGLVDPTGLLGPEDRRLGARSTQPWGSPPVGGSLEAARNVPAKRRRSYHEGVL